MVINLETVKSKTNSQNLYNNPLEIDKIKELLNIEELEYVSPIIKNILNINKKDITYLSEEHKKNFIYRVILYLRISEEDGDLIDGDISRSIRNQLLLLLDECRQNKWKVVGIFCEEGISGGNDNRPEWRKSLKFCSQRRTDIILCKSQSRFSRSMEMIEKYIGCKSEAFSENDMVRLNNVYRSLKDGMAKREDFFEIPAPDSDKADPEIQDPFAAQKESEEKKTGKRGVKKDEEEKAGAGSE